MSNIMTEPDVSQSLPIAPYESDDTTPSSPETDVADVVEPAGDSRDVLIDMPEIYSGPLRQGEKSAEVLETSEISEDQTSSILLWSNQDQIDHRDRIAGPDDERARLVNYLSHFNGMEYVPEGTFSERALLNLKEDSQTVYSDSIHWKSERERANNTIPPTENCAKNNIGMYGVSNSKTMPTNSDLLAAMNSMHLSLERLIMNNVGTFIPPVNGRPLTALNERNRNTTEELRQVDGVLSQEQRGKGRRGGRGKNNRRTPLNYDYGGDSHGSTLVQDYHRYPAACSNDYARGAPSR